MERALNPELLGVALGQHETTTLPTPEELAQLLAEAELALLTRSPSLSEEALAVGWYLHGIASSKRALEMYGGDRQRVAFQVSGHIFDLHLQSGDLSYLERLKYCFAAQVSYLRGTLDPNTIALYRREFQDSTSSLDLLENFEDVALRCGVAFLGLDVEYVYRTTQNLQDQISDLVDIWGVETILATPFGAAAQVARSTRELMSFLMYGNTELLEQARAGLREAVLSESSTEDNMSRWVAAHLLNLSDGLERSSIWTALPPEVPPGVRKAFRSGKPRILTLWPPQVDFLGTEQGGNPLSNDIKRLFLSTPTSSGKTLLAQLLVASHLATHSSSVCYVASTRSLCREIRVSLESRLRLLQRDIVDGLPEGHFFTELFDLEPDVEVMTPERLSYLIRADSSRVIEHFGMFIFDEVHLVGEKGRGWTLEEDLTFLHYATRGQEHRIVLISAAIGNANHFVQWLTNDDTEPRHVPSEWRGPRRVHAIWTTEADWANSEKGINPRARKYPYVESTPLYGNLRVRVSQSGRSYSIRTGESVGVLARKGNTETKLEKDSNKSTPFYKMLVPLVKHLSEIGPVLVVESTKVNALRMAEAVAAERDVCETAENRSLADLVVARLGTEHPLRAIVEKGVAYHHGSLPNEVRVALETSIREGIIEILVATTTMTDGVNLPVTSVVIARQGSYTAEGYQEYITGARLINAVGRAGRATKETEGILVLARNRAPSVEDFDRLTPSSDELTINSMLASEEALEELAEFEDLRSRSEDAVFEVATGSVSSFLRFVWFIAAELEKLNKLATRENVYEVMEHTLGWIQLEPVQRSRWLNAANEALLKYRTTDEATRRRWATSGTSISSSAQVEEIARDLAVVMSHLSDSPDRLEATRIILDSDRLQRLLDLPEAPKGRVYTQRSGTNREEVEVPITEILISWLSGTALVELADTYFSSIASVDYRFEQLGDFIYEYFEVFFPWLFSTIISWTNEILETQGLTTRLPLTLPVSIRYGMANEHALRLMIRGITSRELALKVATDWLEEASDTSVRAWLRSLTLVEWRERFEASPSDLRSLLEFSRTRKGGIAVDLLNKPGVTIQVDSKVVDFPVTPASLSHVDSSDVSPIGIWIGDELVGAVRISEQGDVQMILDSALLFSAEFSAADGEGFLTLELTEPE